MEQRPDVRDIQRRLGAGKETQRVREFRYQEVDDQLKRDKGAKTGKLNNKPYNWERWENDLQESMMRSEARAEAWEALRPFAERPPKDEFEAALQGFYKLQETFRLPGRQFDVQGWKQAREDYLANLTGAQESYVLTQLHPNATPTAEAFYRLREAAKPYREAADTVLGQNTVLRKAYEEYLALGQSQQAEARRRGPELARAVKNIETAREKARINNPDADLYAHLFRGAKLSNRENIDAASAGKLTFAGVPVPSGPDRSGGRPALPAPPRLPRPPMPPQPPHAPASPFARPGAFAVPTPTPIFRRP